jgi:hypothetical protein
MVGRRIFNHLFAFVVVLSLVIWLAAAVLCWRGYWHTEEINYEGNPDCYAVSSNFHGLSLEKCNTGAGLGLEFSKSADTKPFEPNPNRIRLAGFYYEHWTEGSLPTQLDIVGIPEWFLVTAPVILPICWVVQRFKKNAGSKLATANTVATTYEPRPTAAPNAELFVHCSPILRCLGSRRRNKIRGS